jgi:hypothetical protein
VISACLMWGEFVNLINFIKEKPYLSICFKCKSSQEAPKIGALYDLD